MKYYLFVWIIILSPTLISSQSIFGTYGKKGLVSAEGDTILRPEWNYIAPSPEHFILTDKSNRYGVVSANGNWIIPLDPGTISFVEFDSVYYYFRKVDHPQYGYIYHSHGKLFSTEKLWLKKVFQVNGYSGRSHPGKYLVLEDENKRSRLCLANGTPIVQESEAYYYYLGDDFPFYGKSFTASNYGYTIYDTTGSKIEIGFKPRDVQYLKDPNLLFVKRDTGNFYKLQLDTKTLIETDFSNFRKLQSGYLLACTGNEQCSVLDLKGNEISKERLSHLRDLQQMEIAEFRLAGGTGTPIAVSYLKSRDKVFLNERGEQFLITKSELRLRSFESDSVKYKLIPITADSSYTDTDWTRLTVPDECASFIGGDSTLFQYFQERFTCTGTRTLFIEFVIEADGSLSNINWPGGIEQKSECTSQLMSVFQSMPKWNPPTFKGKPVASLYAMMISPRYKKK